MLRWGYLCHTSTCDHICTYGTKTNCSASGRWLRPWANRDFMWGVNGMTTWQDIPSNIIRYFQAGLLGVWIGKVGRGKIIKGMNNMVNVHCMYIGRYHNKTPYFVQFIYANKIVFSSVDSYHNHRTIPYYQQ
jgi:hypothetical protein